jgi:hypothetical protein
MCLNPKKHITNLPTILFGESMHSLSLLNILVYSVLDDFFSFMNKPFNLSSFLGLSADTVNNFIALLLTIGVISLVIISVFRSFFRSLIPSFLISIIVWYFFKNWLITMIVFLVIAFGILATREN